MNYTFEEKGRKINLWFASVQLNFSQGKYKSQPERQQFWSASGALGLAR